MEYTKQQKHEIYKKVLFDIKENGFLWCCPVLLNVCEKDIFDKSFVDNIKYIFNELYEQKTNTKSNLFWFNTRQERIDALKKCIEMTK